MPRKRIRIEEVFNALPEVADLDRPQAMIEHWGTSRHLSTVCRMSLSSVIENLSKLNKEKRAHIADWVPGGQTPIWVKGPGENAVRRLVSTDPKLDKHRAAVKLSRQKAKYDQAQIGQGRSISCATIERAREAGPRSPFAHLFDLAGDES